MAIRFDATGDYLNITASTPATAAFTVAFWVRLTSDTNAFTTFFLRGDGTGPNVGCFSDGTTLDLGDDSSDSNGSALTVGQWYHVAWVHNGDSDNKVYLNGNLDINRLTAMQTPVGEVLAGCWATATGASRLDGRLAYLKLWEAALNQTEIQTEMYRILAQRRTNLYGEWWTQAGSPERLADHSGNGHNFTAGGTLADEAPPPQVFWDPLPYIGLFDPDLRRDAVFDVDMVPIARFDPDLIEAAATGGDGNASGDVGTITLTAAAGSATGNAAASGALATITLTAASGSATGNAAASGAGGTVTLTAPAGGATGTASASGAGATVTMSAPAGGATGNADTSGAGATVTLSAPAGSAVGNADATGAPGTITLTSPAGSATGTAEASGTGATITLSAPAGTAAGNGAASGDVGTITLTAPEGTADGAGNGNASGAVGTITVSAPAGTAVGDAEASGAGVTVVLSAPEGTAAEHYDGNASGAVGTIILIAPNGTASEVIIGEIGYTKVVRQYPQGAVAGRVAIADTIEGEMRAKDGIIGRKGRVNAPVGEIKVIP